MNKFKSIMTAGHTQNKEYLHKLYTDRQVYISSVCSSEQPVEDEKRFFYRNISFQFAGTGFRTPERTVLYVWIPELILGTERVSTEDWNRIACEDFLLRMLSVPINRMSEEMQNDRKDLREKTAFSIQNTNSVVHRRNACIYVEEKRSFRLRLSFRIPLINGHSINGKSTLLDALEQGIYNHVKGDGREYCIMEESACKIYAEEGRYVSNTDLSPFYTHLPGKGEVNAFSTHRASGSVSQAANIVEAVYGGCKCLLIDEDSSAVNFMIRDETMRKLVKKEPIIPFTDRIRELKQMGVSTILVIGGTSEYLKYGDRILLLEDYVVHDRTDETKELCRNRNCRALETLPHTWMQKRYLKCPMSDQPFFYSECVQIENARYIRIDDYVADITKLTAIVGQEQINTLAYLLERILAEKDGDGVLLNERCEKMAEGMFEESMNTTLASRGHKFELCLEEVRSIDLLMALCKLRGVIFS